jgi:hypothetical protein
MSNDDVKVPDELGRKKEGNVDCRELFIVIFAPSEILTILE